MSYKRERQRNSDLWPPLGWEGGEESVRNQLQPGSRINSQENSSCSWIAIVSSFVPVSSLPFTFRRLGYHAKVGPHPRWDHWPLADPQVNALFTWKKKNEEYLTENMDSVITLFLYVGSALSPSILLKFLNLLCVSVSLSSPVFSFKNKFQQWLWQALKEEVLWVCSLGSVAGLLAAELQTALSLSTRAPLQQPPLTLVDLTVPPPSPPNCECAHYLSLRIKQQKNREK